MKTELLNNKVSTNMKNLIGTHCTTLKEDSPEATLNSQIHLDLESLDNTVESLRDTVVRLHERLGHILGEACPSNIGVSTPAPDRSPLAEKLYNLDLNIEGSIGILIEILDTMQI